MSRHSISYQYVVIEQSIYLSQECGSEIALKNMPRGDEKILQFKEAVSSIQIYYFIQAQYSLASSRQLLKGNLS